MGVVKHKVNRVLLQTNNLPGILKKEKIERRFRRLTDPDELLRIGEEKWLEVGDISLPRIAGALDEQLLFVDLIRDKHLDQLVKPFGDPIWLELDRY